MPRTCIYCTNSMCKLTGTDNKRCIGFEVDTEATEQANLICSTEFDGCKAETCKQIKEALCDLVDLKDYKDKNGKDKAYRLMQPNVWQRARIVLA